MALIRSNAGNSLPSSLVFKFCTPASGTSAWTYGTIPNYIVSKYSHVKVHTTHGTLSSSDLVINNVASNADYTGIHTALNAGDATHMNDNVEITMPSNVVNDLAIGGRGSDGFSIEVTLTK